MTDPRALLPVQPDLPCEVAGRLKRDFERFRTEPLPVPLEPYLLEAYGVDVSSSYAGRPIRNPWGKASGQLSMRMTQVREDIAAGLGFIVLKTVIAEDPAGSRSMAAWATTEARMEVEPVVGLSGTPGWSVHWKGRGWGDSLEAYGQLVQDATRAGREAGVPIVPSIKYHLPLNDEPWRVEEYEHTTRVIQEAAADEPNFVIEKDFSPTLAGSGRAADRDTILRWLREVTPLIRHACTRPTHIGLKLFNALAPDEFQVEMLELIAALGPTSRPDFIVFANRLYDTKRGAARGGPDLSDRNLRILAAQRESTGRPYPIPLSATGDISNGRLATFYALMGCRSFQVHTGFQLPSTAYARTSGQKVERALHALTFDPLDGLVAWLLHVSGRLGLAESRFTAVVDAAERLTPSELQATLA